MFMTPRSRTTKWWMMNPWEVEPDLTEEDVWCENCGLDYLCVETKWMPGENVGEAECPVCETKIEVIPDDAL